MNAPVAIQCAKSLMLEYTVAWEDQDIDRILGLYHYPVASLRSGELIVSTPEGMRQAVSKILPWWKRNGSMTNAFDAQEPLNESPTTVIVRVRWGEWSLNVPGRESLPSPTLHYVTSRLKGERKIAAVISEWPKPDR